MEFFQYGNFFLFDYFKPDSNKVCHASPYFLNWGLSHVLSFSFPTQDLFIFTFAWLPLQLLICRYLSQPLAFPLFCSVWIPVSRLASPKLSWISLSPCSLMPALVKQVTSSQTHVPSASDLGRFFCWAEQNLDFTLSSGVWIWFLCEYPPYVGK